VPIGGLIVDREVAERVVEQCDQMVVMQQLGLA